MKKLVDRYGIWFILVFFTTAYFLVSFLRYQHYLAGGYDLPHYCQAVWQYSQLKLARVTIFGNIYILGDHFEPILIFLSLFYWLFSDCRTLLLLQALISVFAAYPLYIISRKIIKNIWLSFIPPLIFLLHPSFQYALDYDFHTSTIMVLPLALLYLAYEQKRKALYWLSIVLIFLTKEDGAIFTLFLGLFQLLSSKNRKQGWLTIFISMIWFYLVQFWLMPFFYGSKREATIFIDFYFLGRTIPEMLKNAITKPWLLVNNLFNHPEKRKTLVLLYGSFSFLPLFSVFSIFNSLPFLAEKFFSQTNSRWLFNQYHHINILPLLTIGFIKSTALIKRLNKKLAYLGLGFSLIMIFFINRFLHLPLTRLFHLDYYRLTQKEKNLNEALSLIPLQASVSAQFPFTSHLSQREKIYLFPEAENEVEYMVLTLNGLPTYPLSKAEIEKKIRNYRLDSRIKVIYEKEGTYFFQRLLIK